MNNYSEKGVPHIT